MSAMEITKALGGKWGGSYGMICCPVHEDRTPSCKVSDGEAGPIFHCFGGCEWRDIRDALRRDGHLPEWPGTNSDCRGAATIQREPKSAAGALHNNNANQKHALEIWQSCLPAPGTSVETYLLGRGITIPVPPSLRYHPNLKHYPTGLGFEAMVGAVQDASGKVAAIHRTYLKADGAGKAGVRQNKMALGPLGTGAVRLDGSRAAMGLAEGIETALSAMQLFEIPVWAAQGARMDRIELPGSIVEVHLFGDNGEPGHLAVERAASIFAERGCRIVPRYPPQRFPDWNDVLQAEGGGERSI